MDLGVALRRNLRSARLRVLARRNGRVTDPVFVLCNGRTGSYLLIDYLNCLPGATFTGEVLNVDAFIGPRRALRTKRSVERHLRVSIDALPARIRGAKLMSFGVAGLTLGDVHRLFPDARFLLLYRRSLAAHYVSKLAARSMKQWELRGDAVPFEGKVRVDPDDFLRFVAKQRRFVERVLAEPWLAQRSAAITYEDLVDDPRRVFDEVVCPFLGIGGEAVELRTKRVKQNPKPLNEVVENYDEVAWLLNGPDAILTVDPDDLRIA